MNEPPNPKETTFEKNLENTSCPQQKFRMAKRMGKLEDLQIKEEI